MSKNRVLSGIRPTGQLHIGNYFGAVNQFVELQNSGNECFFFVADLHALTTINKSFDLRGSTVEIVRSYLACGIDPELSTIYCQSALPEIPYLTTLLGMMTSEAWLRRCTTYKEKAEKQETASLGLLSYPVLMASDILIVNAETVPVGHDQLQHLEMTRDIAMKFNTNFGEVFNLPKAQMLKSIRVPGLDGSGKMGKSDGNTIGLFEDPKSIIKKVKAATTDLGPVQGSEMSPEIKNLFFIMELCCPNEVQVMYRRMYDNLEQKFYGSMKADIAKHLVEFLAPIQENYNSPKCSPDAAMEVLHEGYKKVKPIAEEVFNNAYEKFNLFTDIPIK